MVCDPLPETLNTCAPCSSIKMSNFVLSFAISRQSYLVRASARGHRRTRNLASGPRLVMCVPLPPCVCSSDQSVTVFEAPSLMRFFFYSFVVMLCLRSFCVNCMFRSVLSPINSVTRQSSVEFSSKLRFAISAFKHRVHAICASKNALYCVFYPSSTSKTPGILRIHVRKP